MSKSIFISHVHEDAKWIDKIDQWAKSNKLGNVVITRESQQDMRSLGHDAIRKFLMEKIRGCAIVIVLIGNDTHNHDWIRMEVELANSFNKKVVLVRIPDTTGGLPQIFNGSKPANFDPLSIAKAL